MMMTVDRGASGTGADPVELVTERTHIGSVVLIAGNDLVDRIDDDRI